MKHNKLIISVAAATLAVSVVSATIAIPKTDNVMAAAKKTAKYRYSVQTKKITRTIKMYQPKGLKKVVQKAYIKRKVKTNKKTHKKTYGKWSTSSWKKYKVAKVSGYTASRSVVGAAKVTRKTKNQTVKITYKAIKKKAAKKRTKKTVKKAMPKKRTPKKAVKKSTPKKRTIAKKTVKKPVKKTTPASTNVTVYNSKGKPVKIYKEIRAFGPTVETHIKKGSKVVVLGQGPINGQLMYNIFTMKSNGDYTKEYWVPAKDVHVDYFTGVKFVEYNIDGVHIGNHATPAQIKAKYYADLAEAEKNDPDAGFGYWFQAHPLESLREGSKDIKVSKSTYEKHNMTYAQAAADFGRGSVGFTKESYTAYIKGEKAYRQYEAKWAAEHPNITRYMEELFKNDSDYKKYNLNTFEWHYNDNYYINIRK